MNSAEIERYAQIIWDFHLLHQPLKKVDCILVLGSNDIRVADYAAALYLAGWAPWLLFSGYKGHLTEQWTDSEAEIFARVARKKGIPESAIIRESLSQNTGENILYSKNLLAKLGHNFHSFLLVQKPYMERRAYLTFQQIWPEKEVVVTSPPLSLAEYPNGLIRQEDLIGIIVGDLQRLLIYPDKGFHLPVNIPAEVMQAYKQLIKFGYTNHLIAPYDQL